MKTDIVNTDALLRAASFLFGTGAEDLCALTDLLDNAEREAHAKAFDEGYTVGCSAGYEEGYMAAVDNQNEVDEVFSETAEAVLDADYIPNFRVQTSEN